MFYFNVSRRPSTRPSGSRPAPGPPLREGPRLRRPTLAAPASVCWARPGRWSTGPPADPRRRRPGGRRADRRPPAATRWSSVAAPGDQDADVGRDPANARHLRHLHQVRRPEDHRPRRPAYLWISPCRPRRAPPGRHGHPPARRFSITMEIYTQVSSAATREALKRLGDSLDA
jgi:hypothetical protein